MRVIAVDWSGDAHHARNRIWLAEAVTPGQLVRLEAGRDRADIADHLLGGPPERVIGLDFGFSFPAWFLEQAGIRSACTLWARMADEGERWLAACQPPFWGRTGRGRASFDGPAFRRAELAVPRNRGIGPKSMFQIGGAGTVGTGSLRGMPLLHRLHQAGATVWPFVRSGWPVIVEIYPRLLSGPLTKSDPLARKQLLEANYPALDPTHLRSATLSDDAFDAAVSALVMVEHLSDLLALPDEPDPQLRLEGRIWHPAWRQDLP